MAASAAVARAEVALPVEYCQVRPGRMLAVHRRVHPRATHTLFFVHGSCGSLLQWQAQLDHSSRFSSVLAYDSYGCGRSPKPYEWEAYASHALIADLVALVQRFSASSSSEKLVLVAHSAAAGFALQAVRWLSEAPGEGRRQIAGVVTVSALDAVPSALALFRLPLCVLTRLQPSLSAGFVEGALHEETRAARTEEHQELLSLCDGINEANPMYMCQAYYRQLLTPSDEEIAAVRVPVMLIAGEADKIVPPAASLRWAAILGSERAQLHVLPFGSHQVMQEQPAEVNRLLDRFLDTV
ncbi:hypothetical protein AB1Y20_023465 [Prymnesium parvum]|uniref:AB hydrolase-1 domain-containing protein n=1 Tax=Prymnesium parvum TaxID=97485 RepID=A0AB34JE12_PRYPA